MAISITVSVTGTLDSNEKLALTQAIVRANGALDGGRVVKLPYGTNAELKASYETLLTEGANSVHLANLTSATDQSGLELAGFSKEQRVRIRKALIAGAQAGKGVETLVAAVEKL